MQFWSSPQAVQTLNLGPGPRIPSQNGAEACTRSTARYGAPKRPRCFDGNCGAPTSKPCFFYSLKLSRPRIYQFVATVTYRHRSYEKRAGKDFSNCSCFRPIFGLRTYGMGPPVSKWARGLRGISHDDHVGSIAGTKPGFLCFWDRW